MKNLKIFIRISCLFCKNFNSKGTRKWQLKKHIKWLYIEIIKIIIRIEVSRLTTKTVLSLKLLINYRYIKNGQSNIYYKYYTTYIYIYIFLLHRYS